VSWQTVRDDGVVKPAPAIVYWPLAISRFWNEEIMVFRNIAYAIRTPRLNSPTLLKEIQQAVWSVNGNLPVARVRTLEEIQADSMAQTSFALVMLSIAASVALVLGIVGIYGVISYIATQRTREIGIRIALGAARSDVSRLFLRHGLVLAIVGIAIGIVAAAFVTRVMATLLFGVSPDRQSDVRIRGDWPRQHGARRQLRARDPCRPSQSRRGIEMGSIASSFQIPASSCQLASSAQSPASSRETNVGSQKLEAGSWILEAV
jgi:hypothetical protein